MPIHMVLETEIRKTQSQTQSLHFEKSRHQISNFKLYISAAAHILQRLITEISTYTFEYNMDTTRQHPHTTLLQNK